MVDSSAIKTINLVTLLVAFILGLSGIIVSGIDNDVLNVKWNNSPWRHLGVLQLVSTIYAIVVSLIGLLINFLCSQQKSIFLFVIFLFYF